MAGQYQNTDRFVLWGSSQNNRRKNSLVHRARSFVMSQCQPSNFLGTLKDRTGVDGIFRQFKHLKQYRAEKETWSVDVPYGHQPGIFRGDCGSRQYRRRLDRARPSRAACDAVRFQRRWLWNRKSLRSGISHAGWSVQSSTSRAVRHPVTSTRHSWPPTGRLLSPD